MKRVAEISLAEKQSEGLIFENSLVLAVGDILPDDDVNEAFRKIGGNIAGVEWEAEPLKSELTDAAVHIPHIHNNQYAALADDGDNDKDEHGNDNKSTGVENSNE